MDSAAKGLGKISDYVTPFDGSKPTEFAKFLRDFDRGMRTLEIHPTKGFLLLINVPTRTPKSA